ncbi:MAG TPA: alpha/beta fold hydrolase [Xanthobacteraceae bacterium]|nr:alpha/beta fold hydrolase [Xanthobacteraceae bacterium]
MSATAVEAAKNSDAPEPKLAIEEMMVPALDPGIDIYVRNKRPADMKLFRPARTVLFVHGATYPAHSSFDLALDGLSWMDYIAARGYDVYLMDLRGYGKSTRPKEMAERPDVNPPTVRGDAAIKDVSAVVDFVLGRRNIPGLVLIGWSWGTVLTATYATQNTDKVARLVLYSPIWIGRAAALARAPSARLGAYRTVTREEARARWYAGVPKERKATLIPAGFFETWAQATWASDPEGARMNPPVVRAPNGIIQDGAEYWGAGRAYYDPAKITAPTLLVTAAWDNDVSPAMAHALLPLLVNSPGKRLVELAQGTHSVMMETNRLDLFAAVQAFLDEGALRVQPG